MYVRPTVAVEELMEELLKLKNSKIKESQKDTSNVSENIKSPIKMKDTKSDTQQVGMKDVANKLRWDLLPVELVEEVVRVLTYGANKYPDASSVPNWTLVEDASNKYYAAAMRHIVEYRKGNLTDNESGLLHLAHAITNLLLLINFSKNE